MYRHTFDRLEDINKYFSQYKYQLIHFIKGYYWLRRKRIITIIRERQSFRERIRAINGWYRHIFDKINSDKE